MRIAPLRNIPERPKPVFDNTSEEGVNYSLRRILEGSQSFTEETTFWKRQLGLQLVQCVRADSPGIVVHDIHQPIDISQITLGKNNIGMSVGKVKVQILEHVLGVLYGLGVDADIALDTPLAHLLGISLPTKADCAQQYIDSITDQNTLVDGKRKTFTVREPTRMDFDNKIGSHIILLPDAGEHELIVDLMVSHRGCIGTQRIRCKITEDILRRYIAGARTPSYGNRRKLMTLLDRIPALQRIVNIDRSRTFSFTEESLLNPRPEYMINGINTELLMHEVLDKLGAFGIPLSSKKGRFVGTVMLFASSHGHDLAVMGAMESGDVVTQ